MTNNVVTSVNSWVSTHLARGEKCLVAVSGGPDSMGLLGLLALETSAERHQICVAYVDHGLRPTAVEDWQIVSNFASLSRLVSVKRTATVPDYAREQHMSIEQAARVLRYETLEFVRRELSCKYILTAHTKDDNFETIMMKQRAGSHWTELTGIPARRGSICRPLLTIRRSDLHAWVKANRIPFRHDESNFDLRFRRNKLRAELAASATIGQAKPPEEIIVQAEALASDLGHMRGLAEELFTAQNPDKSPAIYGLEIQRIIQYFNKLTFAPVEAVWSKLAGVPEGRLPSRVRRQIEQIIKAQTPKSWLRLPDGIELERRGGTLWSYRPMKCAISTDVEPGQTTHLGTGFRLALAAQDPQTTESQSRWHIRNWRPGDRVKLPNRPLKKVSNLLCESKLDPLTRQRTLLLTHNDAPVLLLYPRETEQTISLPDGTNWSVKYTAHG